MHITYVVIEKTYASPPNTRASYGIAAYAYGIGNNESAVVVTIHDITPDRVALTKLVTQCNQLKLSPIHLHDIVEDFLES